ncbi:hypothetical protein pb186bvf_008315 [Paramecium bursaria]
MYKILAIILVLSQASSSFLSEHPVNVVMSLDKEINSLITELKGLELNKAVLLQITQGFVMGFYQSGGVNIADIQQCTFEVSGVADDIYNALSLISKFDIKDINEGGRILGYALQILPKAYQDCQVAYNEMNSFEFNVDNAIKILEQPGQLVPIVSQHVINHIGDIKTEIDTSVKDIQGQRFSDFGFQLGELVYQIIVG